MNGDRLTAIGDAIHVLARRGSRTSVGGSDHVIRWSPRREEEPVARSGSKRILVVANETVDSDVLARTIRRAVTILEVGKVSVVSPCLGVRGADAKRVREAAELRLVRCVDRLGADGIDAEGWAADADPVAAVAGALRSGRLDLVIFATRPAGESAWLEADLPARIRRTFRIPLVHVAVPRATAARAA
jgi:hypothetical protein